jgi:hypothetical protein
MANVVEKAESALEQAGFRRPADNPLIMAATIIAEAILKNADAVSELANMVEGGFMHLTTHGLTVYVEGDLNVDANAKKEED